ncbi:MAG: DUF4199 domain-containing protein [Cytophagia bacterium]|nr:DUF4199 domain-containing protein [Cytophagia bacterium]NBW35557.1 DUF4199 domain-containing protein [Cytophagia bacterium]
MKINTPLVWVPLRYGAIASIIAFALVVVLYFGGRHPFLIPMYADFRIFLFGLFLFFSLKEFRDQYKQGVLYFFQGMVASYVFLLSFALLSASFIWVFAATNDEFVKEFIRLFIEQASTIPMEDIERVGKDNFERNLAGVSNTNAFEMAKNYFRQSLLIGFFISIIVTIILRKQPKQ